MNTITRRNALLAGSSALLLPSAGRAQAAWPTQTVTFVVGYAAGGGADIVARELAHLMTPLLGQQVCRTVLAQPRLGGDAGVRLWQSGLMAQQLSDGDRCLVRGAELRPVVGHGRVEVEQSAVDQECHGERGGALAAGVHGHDGVGWNAVGEIQHHLAGDAHTQLRAEAIPAHCEELFCDRFEVGMHCDR